MTQQQPTNLDPDRTAVVIMDFQVGIVANYASDPPGVLARSSAVLSAARGAGIPVIYVRHGGGAFAGDRPDTLIAPEVAPQAEEMVFLKRRTGAFSTTGLDVHLRESGRDTLVLLGVSTSGCVLSTVRHATDLAYRVVVVRDACDDTDAEVHRVLTEKVYPRQASVMSAAEFAAAVRA